MTRRAQLVMVMAVAAIAALLGPAVAALTLPRLPLPAPPTVPTSPTVPPVTGVTTPPNPPNVISPVACPGNVIQVCTTTLGDQLQDQLQALADASGLLPADLLNQLLTLYIPTPAGAVETLTLTVQNYIDRLGQNALVGGKNTGFLGTPEVAAGSILHNFGYVRTYDSGATRPYPSLGAIRADMPQYRKYEANLTVSTPALSGALAGSIATPLVNGALCSLLTPPTTTPAPSNCRIQSSLVPLPVALPASPVPPGTYPPALLPKLPTAIFSHAGGRLVNVQGGGWDARGPDASRNIKSQAGFGSSAVAAAQGARHTGGNSSSGTNLDTAPKPTVGGTGTTADPLPIYIPLLTSNPNVGAASDASQAPADRSIDFLGFATVGQSTKIECKAGTTVIDTEAKLDALAPAPGGTWPELTCTSVGTLTGDGVANFGGWPLNFHDDLSFLWTPAPPSVDAVNAAFAAMLATAPTSQLQTYGLIVAFAYLPYVTGLQGYRPVPLPALPVSTTVPALP